MKALHGIALAALLPFFAVGCVLAAVGMFVAVGCIVLFDLVVGEPSPQPRVRWAADAAIGPAERYPEP